jgi:hypothetical protein
MSKYHVNPETGNPGVCKAEKQCRFGGAAEHFSSPEAARSGYEKAMTTSDVPLSKRLAKGAVPKTKEAPKYEAVKSDGTRGFSVTISGKLGGGTETRTIYAKTASEARNKALKSAPKLAKVTGVTRKLAPTPEQSAHLQDSINDMKRVQLETEVEDFLRNTEMGGQFNERDFHVAKDAKTFSLKVDLSFSDRGQSYKYGDSVRFDRDFNILGLEKHYRVTVPGDAKKNERDRTYIIDGLDQAEVEAEVAKRGLPSTASVAHAPDYREDPMDSRPGNYWTDK